MSLNLDQERLILLLSVEYVSRVNQSKFQVNDCSGLRSQPVDATHWLNRSAGVSKFNVFLGRSLSRLATAPPQKDIGTEGNDFQFYTGTDATDKVSQYGYGGNDTQVAEVLVGNDKVKQYGGTRDDTMRLMAGPGDDRTFQYGEDGNDDIALRGEDGTDKLMLDGGAGNDVIWTDAGLGNDTVKILSGSGDDAITYNVSDGTEKVTINGGLDVDDVTVNSYSAQNFTIFDADGIILFAQGVSGSKITLTDTEGLIVIGDEGVPVFPIPDHVNYGSEDADLQSYTGTVADEVVAQVGYGGNDTLTIVAGEGNDTVKQDGWLGNDTIDAFGGDEATA